MGRRSEMMDKEVIFIFWRSPTPHHFHMCGVPDMMASGVKFEFWDLSRLIYPSRQALDSDQGFLEELKNKYPDQPFKSFESFKDFERFLSGDVKKRPVLIFFSPINIPSHNLLKLLQDKGFPLAAFRLNAVSMPPLSFKQRLNIKKYFRLNSFGDLWNRGWYSIAKRTWLKSFHYDKLVYSGRSCLGDPHRGPNTELIKGASLDFEKMKKVLQARQAPVGSAKRYALFIDSFLPYHTDFMQDFSHMGESYYGKLRQLFDKISDELGIQVVIAAHPKVDMKVLNDHFEGRYEIIIKETFERLPEAEFVMIHNSTMMGLCAALRVPMVFLSTDETDKILKDFDCMDYRSHEFGQPHVKVEKTLADFSRFPKSFQADSQAYGNYTRRFVMDEGAPAGNLWQSVSQSL